jgi:hypothetical protein
MLPPERRREIAEPLGISEQYLYQILRGDGVASPALARRLNAAEPSLALRDLRPDDWQDIWPELAEPPALDHQAPAAINSEAKEVAHA